MIIPYHRLQARGPEARDANTAQLDALHTPVGTIAFVVWHAQLVFCTIGPDAEVEAEAWSLQQGLSTSRSVVPVVRKALAAYFEGDLEEAFSHMSYAFVSGTDFQRRIWTALAGISPGTTTSYGALAAALDQPRAVRAVGRAVGANPLALFLPCHRVVGSAGALTGFTCGIPVKRQLLVHENVPMGAGDRVLTSVAARDQVALL